MGVIDEFSQTARKYNVRLYTGTQQAASLPSALRSSTFVNNHRFFAFASSAADAAFLAKEFGGRESELVAEMLPELKTGQALVKVRGEPVVLLQVLQAGGRPTPEAIARGQARCLTLGMSREQVDKELEQRRRQFASRGMTEVSSPASLSRGSESEPEGYEPF